MNINFPKKIIPVILSGGSGKRLWPLSRTTLPKQYLKLNIDSNYTLLQDTYLRLQDIEGIQSPLIICNQEQRFIVAEQMRQLNIEPKSILLEPFGRNTAPAITLSALSALDENKDSILLILPADHKIKNHIKFVQAVKEGLKFVNNGRIVAFGVLPKSPETGYGYIESKEEISEKNISSEIKKFIEKPTQVVAKKLFKDKHFSWNSGILLVKASTIIHELKKYSPQIVEICQESIKGLIKDLNFQRINPEKFEKCPKISIDKAIMEKTSIGTVINLDAGWNDLGSWKSLWEDSSKDNYKNTLKGKTYIKDVKNSYLRSESRLLVGLGLENLLIIETDDSVLVANKDNINCLKDLINDLEEEKFEEICLNKKTHRPWGHYLNLINTKHWQVKKLEINPGECISLQKHIFRSENWIVVKGNAKVEINEKVLFLKKNESIYVPSGSKHRLSNPGKTSLIVIEVQSGSYLGEDDIIRFEDKYRRSND